jgi:ankyrin repeat protein
MAAVVDPINDRGETPLAVAASLGRLDVVRELVRQGADVNHAPEGGESVLLSALRADQIRLAHFLMQSGADITASDGEDGGVTPIHVAAQLGLDDVLSVMLVAHGGGVHPDAASAAVWSGRTPLFAAVEAGRVSTVRLLLRHGANRHALDAWGNNVLAVAAGTPSLVKLLVSKGVAVNHRNDRGATALHHAALGGHLAGAKLLLQKGARQFHASAVFDSVDEMREGVAYRQGTPAGIARQKGYLQLAMLIERWKVKKL